MAARGFPGFSPSRMQTANFCLWSFRKATYCPKARRKTLSRVASNRRVEERRDTDIKSAATFGNLSALPLGEEFVFERSTKRNEISPVLSTANEIKPFPSPPKCRPPQACLVFLVAIRQYMHILELNQISSSGYSLGSPRSH
ncbi:hypothetical protein AVEN_263754-1 [Araneus ventricosus]|uniref:Uncharacterized protein n=1 Tax=Araneus ventricosus TaxID=182803 RepID=A0A4Y2ASB3_ARAVE|nr:hypothetical protein AVEN_263754-1 [Araneus ventricosus]